MTATQNCSRCDTPLPPDAPGGACPRCLLAAGLDDTREVSPRNPMGPAPSAEQLSRAFPELEIIELIGRGGMGIVYKARQLSLDRMVALKVLPGGFDSVPGFAERFSREARMLARLDHPNIVRIHEFGERGGMFFLTMELVDGVNLRQLMARKPVLPRDALRLVPQVCDALQYAHDAGVVHRDIKPENILIDHMGRVKIADFGLAKMVQQGPRDYTITGTGDVMGTVHYMAPEQFSRPTEVDHRADIYSLGVVFYEMLTGDLPIGRFQPPSQKVEVDQRIDDIVMRTLERERDLRYQSVDEVRTDVFQVSHEAPGRRTRSGQPVAARAAAGAAGAAGAIGKPKLCKNAVIGAAAMPASLMLGIMAGLIALSVSDDPSSAKGVSVFYLVVIAGMLLGFLLSLISWIGIGSSKGTRRGLGYAITGTLLPVLAGIPMLGLTLVIFYRAAAVHDGGGFARPALLSTVNDVHTLASSDDEQSGVSPLWEAFRKRVRQSGIASPRMNELFLGTQWRPHALDADIAQCTVRSVSFLSGQDDVASVVVESDSLRAKFTVARVAGRWYFHDKWEVQRRSAGDAGTGDVGNGAAGTGDAATGDAGR